MTPSLQAGAPAARRAVAACLGSAAAILILAAGCSTAERSLLFHPSHDANNGGLPPWTEDGRVIGYSRAVAAPANVWLLLHGNAGQAAQRTYALPSFAAGDSVFIMEYPGYGQRGGVPSRESFDAAARDAYLLLRRTFPSVPVCVASESIGSGPASSLALLARPPDKFVLIVPFDRLSLVARDHYPALLVRLVLDDDWDNIRNFSTYHGPVDIYGAEADAIIPVSHARALAAAIPTSRFILVEGGHNEWSHEGRVWIRNP